MLTAPSSSSSESVFENLFELIHAIPGRVRLRVQNNQEFDAAIALLRTKIESLQENCVIKPHSATRSIVVQFDPKAPSLFLEQLPLIQPQNNSQSSPQNNHQSSRTGNQTEPHQSNQKSSQQSKPTEPSERTIIRRIAPLVTGYATVQILGVSGLLSLPVFLVSDIVTREALKHLFAAIDESTEPPVESEDAAIERELEPHPFLNGLLNGSQNGSQRVLRNSVPSELNGSAVPIAGFTPIHSPTDRAKRSTEFVLKHSLPGRIRYQIPRLIYDAEYGRKLIYRVESDRRVTGVKVNSASGSLTIYYLSQISTPAELQANLEQWIENADSFKLPALTPKASASDASASDAKSSKIWDSLGLPAASLGLSVLWGIGLPIPPALVAGTVAIAAIPVVQRAIAGIVEEKKLTIDFLDLAAITITTVQGSFLNPAIMIALIEFGEAIREQSARSSQREVVDLLSSLEAWVWVERNGRTVQVLIEEVQHGETIVVYPGEQIPVDGTILSGTALIDEQKLTGEAMPVLRQIGQTVYASTLVRDGWITVRAERLNDETRAGQILKVMQDAPVHDTRIGNYAAAIADRMVIPTLLMSAVTFGFTGNLARAASILTLDFATGIRVSVPTTVLAALTFAARRGILIRSGRTLEQLARVDAVVFDKTGTLTQGEPIVVSVETVCDATSSADLLSLAAAAEQHLTHPVAEAVVRCARERGIKIPDRGQWDYEIGRGVRAVIDGQNILVGSRHFMESEGIDLLAIQQKHQSLQANGHSVIYVAAAQQLRGVIVYRDPLRPESRDVISSLRQTGIMDVHLLTGDNKRTAATVAHELGIAAAHTYAEAFPEQKVAVVRGLHADGKTVAFVGDGINDSPALAHADVSVSFANGSDVARETADVVLMENNLRGLPEAIAIARQAMQLIHQNTGIVAVPNLSAMLIAVTVGIPPLAATLVNNGSTIVAGLNGLRPLMNRDRDLNLLANRLEENSQSEAITVDQIQVAQAQFKTSEVDLIDIHLKTNSDRQNAGTQTISIDTLSELLSEAAIDNVIDDATAITAEGVNEAAAALPLSEGEICPEAVPQPSNQQAEPSAHPKASDYKPLSSRALAKRLHVSPTTLNRYKAKPDFSDWSRSLDPEGIAWCYQKASKQFTVLNPVLS